MPDVKGLGDVRRRVLDDQFLSNPDCVRSVRRFSGGSVVREGVDLREHFANEVRVVKLKVEKVFIVRY